MKRLATTALALCTFCAGSVGAPEESVNVKNLGAVCDGVSDDTRIIQRALDSGSKSVRAPSGVCRVSTLTIPSNVELRGEGWSTVFLLNDNVHGAVLVVANGATDIALRDFKVSANSRNQNPHGSSAGILVHGQARRVHIENVWVDDVADWGFHINGAEVTLSRTKATNITGARGENSVRAGYLVGSGLPPVEAVRVTMDDAEVSGCALPHTNGFMLERGSGIVLRRSRAIGCSWTCFKIRTDRTVLSENQASHCGIGFQTQGPVDDLTLVNNASSHNKGSGYQFNQLSVARTARNWRIANNRARNNGQPPGNSTTYGFAFENLPGALTEAVYISSNEAIDDQPVRTQLRGFSFGNHGRYANVHMSGNTAKGNQVDYFLGPSFDSDSFTEGERNVGTAGRLSVKTAK
jgi:hypothetical protein